MKYLNNWFSRYWLILLFVCAKLILHLITNTNYGFQRDAYLYLAQSQHLDWGYFSTPPLTAFFARIHTAIWGDSLWAVRLLPTFFGSLIMFLVGWLIINLKGEKIAQLIGMTACLLSPAFLRPSLLLQPTVINHFFWLMTAVVVFIIIRKEDPRYFLLMIPVLGFGWLNKYSIIFYGLSILAAFVISRHRKLLWSKYLIWTIIGGILIIFPNLLWQYNHNWPVFHHMSELQQHQLVNVKITDFIFSQLMMHFPAFLVWGGGLVFLLLNKEFRKYRIYAWAFLLTLLLIILLKGKSYYTIGAYTILVVFGAIAWERWVRKTHVSAAILVLGVILATGINALPFSLPIFKPDRMTKYGEKMIDRGLGVMLKWEDGNIHNLPQDYADMVGWNQLGEMVWEFYESLDDSIRNSTLIYCENYGQAGSVYYHRPSDKYPEVFSFNDAFMEWIPRYFYANHVIYVGYSERLPQYFESLELIGTVEDTYFRENGLPIHFGSYPTEKLFVDWEETWLISSGQFSRNVY